MCTARLLCPNQLTLKVHVKEISDATHLEPLDGISLGDLMRETDLGHFLLALRHSVTRTVEHNVKVHAVDAYKEVRHVEKRVPCSSKIFL